METKKSLNIVLIIEAVLLFCASGAYFFWFSKFSVFLSLCAVLFPLILSGFFYKKLDTGRLPMIVLFSIVFALHSHIIGGSIVYSLFLAIVPLFLLVPVSFRTKIIDFYVIKVFPILLLLSVGTYILEGFNITHLPVFPVQPVNDAKNYFYISHIFFLQDSDASYVFSRFNSYYEECGVIGSIVALFLFSHGEKMPIWVRIVYIFTGFLTFSLFFYVMFILYLLVNLRNIRKGGRNIIIITLITIAVVYIVLRLFESDFLETYIYNRFSIEDGRWLGNDRAEDHFISYFWENFIKSDDFWFGTTSVQSEGWSIYRCIVENGFIVVAITSILYFSCILRNKTNKNRWIYLIVFFAMFYQRPEFWSVFYFIFFTTISEHVSIEETDKEQIKGKLSFISKT